MYFCGGNKKLLLQLHTLTTEANDIIDIIDIIVVTNFRSFSIKFWVGLVQLLVGLVKMKGKVLPLLD